MTGQLPESSALALLRFTGPLAALPSGDRAALRNRAGEPDSDSARPDRIAEVVARIITRVRRGGDAAVRDLALELDGVALESLEVPRARRRAAIDLLDRGLRKAMERACRNLDTAHRAMLPPPAEVETEPGVVVGRRADPLASVGIYAPGGRASYPSSVLMAAIPARVAGVREIVLCSPPEASGHPPVPVLAAAELSGVGRVFGIGGAGAIAAMAYGTESVPRVERIVGPGNAYVAAAKLAVSSDVAIDSPAGPSELLVIADRSADPAQVARELVAQAEHDPLACGIAIALDATVARRITEAVDRTLAATPRRDIAATALATRGGVLIADSLAEAIAFANDYAAEHLMLAIAEPDAALAGVRNAGAVFLGATSSVAFGDYLTGGNHVLPTGGYARRYSGLSTLDFMRWTTYQRVSAGAAVRLANDVALFADVERLPAHGVAARGAASGALSGAGGNEAGSAAPDPLGPAIPVSGSIPGTPSPSWLPGVARVTGKATRVVPPGEVDPLGGSLPSARPSLRARDGYSEIRLYSPYRASVGIDLSDNTNLFGVPPAARRVLRRIESRAVSRYPSTYGEELKGALAEYAGVPAEAIVTGCGSDDLIDSAIRAFSDPGDRIAFADPTFAMMPTFARMNGLEPVAVPLTRDRDLDADALLATRARILYLCSPNNPTGTMASPRSLARVISGAKGLVILDRAYAEYAGVVSRMPRSGRVLIVRTLSKAFGLAGLRIGYAIGAPALVAEVEKSRGPFKVAGPAERAAVAALRESREWIDVRVRAVRRNRARFTRGLEQLGLRPLPSRANFVLVPVPDAAALTWQLRTHGVAVRPFPALHAIGDAVRITIGPWLMMQAALAALEVSLAAPIANVPEKDPRS